MIYKIHLYSIYTESLNYADDSIKSFHSLNSFKLKILKTPGFNY